MRIGLDVTPLASPLTGIGTFVQRLSAAVANDPDLTLRPIALTGRSRITLNRQLPDNVAPVTRSFPARPLLEAWRRADLPTVGMLFGSVDLVHGTNFYCPPAGKGAPEVLSVHDTGPWLRPNEVDRTARLFPALAERAIARGAHVHTLSVTAGKEIQALLGIDADHLHPIPLAVDPVPAVELSGRWLTKVGDRPFVLAIGTVEPRKQFPELVRACSALFAEISNLQVVIAGGPGPDSARLAAAVEELGEWSDRIHLAGFVSRNERHALLRAASVVVSAAKTEGFGMVPLEAMAAGTPVIATNSGAQPEICGDAAALVPVGDWDALTIAIGEVLGGDNFALIDAGRRQAARFTWKRTTDSILALYRELLS
ncbi:MAG: glycosyltransferase family 4 protein [Acidimicrobiales bacterium]|nr:glycosyltransferase family 4 protein [Acidimicrobiales bacterium]